jgi:hypothetical protein
MSEREASLELGNATFKPFEPFKQFETFGTIGTSNFRQRGGPSVGGGNCCGRLRLSSLLRSTSR